MAPARTAHSQMPEQYCIPHHTPICLPFTHTLQLPGRTSKKNQGNGHNPPHPEHSLSLRKKLPSCNRSIQSPRAVSCLATVACSYHLISVCHLSCGDTCCTPVGINRMNRCCSAVPILSCLTYNLLSSHGKQFCKIPRGKPLANDLCPMPLQGPHVKLYHIAATVITVAAAGSMVA